MVVSEFVQSIKPLFEKFGFHLPDIRIQGMTLDSREVSPHTAFLAIKGHSLDGRDFIPQAISLGAPVIVAETEQTSEHGQFTMRGHTLILYWFELNEHLSAIAAAFYDYPSNKMDTVAVTGTNGKTSTVNILTQCRHFLGSYSASIGTLGHGIYKDTGAVSEPSDAINTTPDAISFQYILADFAQQDVQHVAFEASSHALVQGRLRHVNTNVAVFTNLSRDHLDYHHSMENYAAAKRLLLDQPSLEYVVVNTDDEWSSAWLEGAAARSLQVVSVAISREPITPSSFDYYCHATGLCFDANGCQFELHTHQGNALIHSPLLGEFNIYNLLCAAGVLLCQGESLSDIKAALERVHAVAGRMEVFSFSNRANVVVDYAHTPDALAKSLQAVEQHLTHSEESKCWLIFGCGGDRDQGKRPQMARVAESLAQEIVLTADNTRSEALSEINEQIMQGFLYPEKVIQISDRESAIRHCLDKANANDLILVAGKGHENYQIIGQESLDYDERATVMRLQQECII